MCEPCFFRKEDEIMKRVMLLSHCILNSFCEMPMAPDNLRKRIIDIITEKNLSIIQLPCPELSYQGLARKSICPHTAEAEEYRRYCEDLLENILSNIAEYKENNIEIVGIIGIDTSPSCSTV